MEWMTIENVLKYTPILLGKWSKDDGIWLWQATGCIEDEGMWIDFTDSFHDSTFFHEATHWCRMNHEAPKA